VEKLLLASFTKFYNKIMTGRLMNRLSKDIFVVDDAIAEYFLSLLLICSQVISIVIFFAIIVKSYTSVAIIICVLAL